MSDTKNLESDLTNTLEGKFHCPTDGTKIQISNNLSVQLGAPLDKRGKFYIPSNPYVYTTDQLSLRDKDHQSAVVLENVTVIIAHGVRRDEEWEFLNGQPIADTVTKYNKWADLNKMPCIGAVIACNEDPLSLESGIQVFELPREGINPFIIHAVGEEINASCFRLPDGKLWTKISTENTSLLNLDEAIIQSKITIQ
ncbi:MAG TPA: hypothetical protein VI795_00060 [Patescibacteria group bacterium]|nr:hypothetical protein [Patescibacteria group bacterium]